MKLTAIQLGHMESILSVNVPKENLASDLVRSPCISGRYCRPLVRFGFSIRNPSVHVLFASDDPIQYSRIYQFVRRSVPEMN